MLRICCSHHLGGYPQKFHVHWLGLSLPFVPRCITGVCVFTRLCVLCLDATEVCSFVYVCACMHQSVSEWSGCLCVSVCVWLTAIASEVCSFVCVW